MTQHEKLFESLPPTRLFFRCALPSMISMAMLSLYTVADGIFVGRYVGPNALAAVNLVMPLIMMSFALVDLVAVGSSVQISIRLGEKNERAANRIFSFCTGLIVALSCVIGLGGFFLAGPMVSLMGAEAEVTAMGAEYMQVYAVFAPVIMVFFAVDNYLRICGRVRYSMILNVVTALLNIVLDFLFLVVFRWGVAAAAAASCLSIALGTVLGFLPFVMGRLPLRFVRGTISARQLGNILANGSSEFFSSIAGSVMMVILNSVLLRLSGSMAVAAFSIVMYVDSIVDGMLKGLDQQAYSFRYNFMDSIMRVVLIAVLLPVFGVKAYIFILFLSEIFNASLSISRLLKVARVDVDIIGWILTPAVSAALLYYLLTFLKAVC